MLPCLHVPELRRPPAALLQFRSQKDCLAEGVDLLVASPGRFLEHLRKGNVNLSATRAVVLDEVDVLYSQDSAFLEQVGVEQGWWWWWWWWWGWVGWGGLAMGWCVGRRAAPWWRSCSTCSLGSVGAGAGCACVCKPGECRAKESQSCGL
jgi:hypothetical protein